MEIKRISSIPQQTSLIHILDKVEAISELSLQQDEADYILKNYDSKKNNRFYFNRYTHLLCIQICSFADDFNGLQQCRMAGDTMADYVARQKFKEVVVNAAEISKEKALSFVEGMALGAYKFEKYKQDEKAEGIEVISLKSDATEDQDINSLKNVVEACYIARDMGNEPVNVLGSREFADQISECCGNAGAKVTILSKKDIEKLGMTGLLTVNKGSKEEPLFVQLEWNADRPVNNQPIILVGKGLVFDTGGINLKPGKGLEEMKCDMAGGAAVAGVLYAIAKNKLPVHVIGLIPITDNRPGETAMVPGDIIRMANGKTVEILNTDAEGRLILADALHYASRFNPQLVIDIATLTGSAAHAIGRFGVVAMHRDAQIPMELLQQSSNKVFERVVEFPFWDEYDKEIESDYADIRNIGKSGEAGAITAGKFLAHFISYPWIHIDIAGMAFLPARESYLGKGATAVGVRLLYDFIYEKVQAAQL